ncbi:MAG: RNA 2',3'-cyclic phosphodiesterase [Bacteroidales bacterium]|nr:RNA 2',3'-cyclic phosphodiesterase [Bacteroidales bacterium]
MIKPKRTFIALKIEPSDVFYTAIADIKTKINNNNINWSNEEGMHLTILYLGSTTKTQQDALEDIIQNVAKEHACFYITIRGFGLFLKNNIPKVIWAGINQSEVLNTIYYKIKEDARKIFDLEIKKISPHVTIGRIKNNSLFDLSLLKPYEKTIFTEVQINSIYLYESLLTPSGAKYKPMKIFMLKT